MEPPVRVALTVPVSAVEDEYASELFNVAPVPLVKVTDAPLSKPDPVTVAATPDWPPMSVVGVIDVIVGGVAT